MLNLKENRDSLIRRAIESIAESEVVEFEYEPSEIINALFETESGEEIQESFAERTERSSEKSNGFKRRKLKELQESKEISFFPNSNSYLRKATIPNTKTKDTHD